MAAAAAELKVPLPALKKLKREGAPGFRGSRVYPDELLPYLRAHQEDGDTVTDQAFALECRKLVAQCERLEFDNAIARREYRNVAEYNERHLRFGSRVNLIFRLKRNLAPIEVRPLWDKLHGEVMDEMRAAYEMEFPDEEAKTDEHADRIQDRVGHPASDKGDLPGATGKTEASPSSGQAGDPVRQGQ